MLPDTSKLFFNCQTDQLYGSWFFLFRHKFLLARQQFLVGPAAVFCMGSNVLVFWQLLTFSAAVFCCLDSFVLTDTDGRSNFNFSTTQTQRQLFFRPPAAVFCWFGSSFCSFCSSFLLLRQFSAVGSCLVLTDTHGRSIFNSRTAQHYGSCFCSFGSSFLLVWSSFFSFGSILLLRQLFSADSAVIFSLPTYTGHI